MPFIGVKDVQKRRLGDKDVFPIGFGAMGLSTAYGTASTNDEERLKFLDAVYESGVNHWDTADVYKDSEDLLGKWFKRSGKRSEVFLSTKFGFKDGGNIFDASPQAIRESIASSLKRLDIDYIDLYYMHRPDKKVPIEHSMTALKELVEKGKIRYIGISECSASTLRRAYAIHPVEAIQIEYSPFCLDAEGLGVIAAARELGVKVVAYSPLGRGLLTGRYTSPNDFPEGDFRRFLPKFSEENFPHVLDLVKKLGNIGAQHGATSGQVTLAWLLAQGVDVLPIPGTTKLENLKENVASASLLLSESEVTQIREIAEKAATSFTGDRYPAFLTDMLFGDTPALE